jgi:putative ABC transport system ATP-binding protein
MEVLAAQNITKTFGNNKTKSEVLKGIDFSVQESDFVSILGKSGSGKSTLLYILSGMEPPTSGDVLFRGNKISDLGDKEMSKLRRSKFGFIFQFYNLLPNFKAIENIKIPLEIDGIKNNQIRDRIDPLIDYLKIKDILNLYPYQLSGGQQQRIAIARALSINPDVIFADEPTGSLDSENGIHILNLLKSINEEYKTTIIMVTHDKNASSFSNVVINLEDGFILY